MKKKHCIQISGCAKRIGLDREHFWQQIKRGVIAGMPEWYKELLAASAFESNVQPK